MTAIWALGLLVGINPTTCGWATIMIATAQLMVVGMLTDEFSGAADL